MDHLSQEIVIVIIFSLLLSAVAIGIIILVFLHQKKQMTYLKEKEQLQGLYEKGLLEAQLEIQEQTFQNISQEIHDNIGQTLSLAKLHLGTITEGQPEKNEQKLVHSRELVGKAIQDLRSLSRTLHTDAVLFAGLLTSIESELGIIERSGEFATSLEISGNPLRLDPQKELILFRIVQEALNNSIKHSKATKISVKASYGHQLDLTISDNGNGFNNSEQEGRSGLRNMQNRSALIGASIKIESNAQSGTTIHLSIPMPQS